MATNNIYRLSNYYDHLIQMHKETANVLSDKRGSIEPLLFERLTERYFQALIDDIRGIDNEYGKLLEIYSSHYSILKEDNKLSFISKFIDSDLTTELYEFGKVRNNIVHSPWIVDTSKLQTRIHQLLIDCQMLIHLFAVNWICGHCKSLVISDYEKEAVVSAEIICSKCGEKSVVISTAPLVATAIPTNSEIAQKYFDEGKMWYGFAKDGKDPDFYLGFAIKKYEKSKEYGHKYAPREIGLICIKTEGKL